VGRLSRHARSVESMIDSTQRLAVRPSQSSGRFGMRPACRAARYSWRIRSTLLPTRTLAPPCSLRVTGRSVRNTLNPSTLFHGIEITVVVDKFKAVLDAECRDQDIDGLADSDALSAQRAVVLRRRHRHIPADEIPVFQAFDDLLCDQKFFFLSNP
jgi:hypothetical protein